MLKHTCNPSQLSQLSDTFSKGGNLIHYLTPVFFKKEVLDKYFSDTQKYQGKEGCLWCGRLWHISIDVDNDDYVTVFLGDLGRGIPEKERFHWLAYNIPPHGRTLSKEEYLRSFMAEYCESTSLDCVFKKEYARAQIHFEQVHGWSIYLPLHEDDKHCLSSFHILANNISVFEKMIKFMTKLLIDSLNEREIYKNVSNRKENEKGITKLEKFFLEIGIKGFDW